MASLKYWLWLSECKNLYNSSKLLLLDYFGSPENVYYAEEQEYCLVEGLEISQAKLLRDKSTETADRILGECRRLGIQIITMHDAIYPVRLRNIFDPPILLYVKGKLPVLDEEVTVAMVGAREATPYGISCAERLSYEMAKQGALIISGAARGIDTASHRGALRAGKETVAVLGCGIDVVYPPENRWLYRDIETRGALISEYAPGTAAIGGHFPVRNRIISGLSLATVVVEAGAKSGALITANLALEQGRDIYAVPGPIDAPASTGCNRLIADGAGLVTCGLDVLRDYLPQYPHKLSAEEISAPKKLGFIEQELEKRPLREEKKEVLQLYKSGLTDDQIALLKALSPGEKHVDDLIEETQIPTRRVLSALTVLQISGYVTQESGKHFLLNVELSEE